MNYSIKPGEKRVRNDRRRVENTVQKWRYTVETEEVEISLGWQYIERPVSMMTWGNHIHLVLNLEDEFDESNELDRIVLRGLLEIEFREKLPIDEIEFDWQELLMIGYVKVRESEIRDSEITENPELGEDWQKLKEMIVSSPETMSEDYEYFHRNSGVLAGMLAEKLLEKNEVSEFPKLKRSDLIEAGDELFE